MAPKRKAERRLDFGTVGGLVVALAGILGGYRLEHGSAGALLGESAALIVFGGCLGATLVANPPTLVKRALLRARDVLLEPADESPELIESLVSFALRARKNGIVSLEQEAIEIPDPFLRKCMTLAVDGMDLQEIRGVMELEMDVDERRREEEAKVFESAGGFAPTIGIIGAVLGLIIVMEDISNSSKLGKGIAAAFVATIYGVGSANLLFLPAAHKIKLRAAAERQKRELILEGVCGIVEGMNPKMIRSKLAAFVKEQQADRASAAATAARRSAA